MGENESNTPLSADNSAELKPPRTESEILEECFPEAERKKLAARFCQLRPDASDTNVQEQLYINLLKDQLWLDFGVADISKATSVQIGHCIKKIKELDNLKDEEP